MEIQREINSELIKSLLKQAKRADGRGKLQYRKMNLDVGVIPNAEGSALCRIGNTQVLAAIKIGLATPFADRPDEGILSTNAEFTPIGASHFEPGPPPVEAVELARVVVRGIRSSNILDLKSLKIENSEFVKAVYLDLWIMDHDGNLFDASALAAIAALKNTYLPKIEGNKIIYTIREEKLQTYATPISCTFGKIDEYIILDPTFGEEMAIEGMITITTSDQYVCAVQKSKGAGFSKKEIIDLIEISMEKANEIRQMLKI